MRDVWKSTDYSSHYCQAYILVGGAILIFPGPIIYIVGDSHERCTGVHWLSQSLLS